MNREERLQRIGELLSTGVTFLLMREAERERDRNMKSANANLGSDKSDNKGGPTGNGHNDAIESQILNYLKRFGAASPRDIQGSLGLPKTTVFRHLARLVQNRVVFRSGKTTSIRYRATHEVVQVDQDMHGIEPRI